MSNGFSNEQMFTLILERLDKLDSKQDSLLQQITIINTNGCAKRESDIARVDKLETWRDLSIVGVISTLLTSIGALIAALWGTK